MTVDRERIVELLRELGRRLAARGITGGMYVVGGNAIALAFDDRRATSDIDAVYGDRLDPAARFFVEELFSN